MRFQVENMKRVLLFASAVFAIFSCSGTVDPEQDGEQDIPEEFTGPYTLSADKTEVEASGEDYVTFSLKDAYGREMLEDEKILQSVNITSDQGQRVPRMETKTRFIANGIYTFTAKFKGQASENTVKVVAKNRGQYEKFHKNVAIYKATALGCGPCAAMTRALEGLNEEAKDHSVELCWHYGPQIGGISDWYAISIPGFLYDCGVMVMSHFGGAGVPTVGLDLIEPVTEKSSAAFENAIWNLRADFPATCGIKISTDYNSAAGTIDINAELKSSAGGEYDLGMAVLLNDQIEPQGTNDGGKYTHIVRATTSNFLMYSGAIRNVGKGETASYEQKVPWTGDTKDLSVVAFALVKHGDGARIDNIVEVKVGETKDYVYND